ncbi:hypothetical protein [Rheinheimera sp.]|uniref:hypothetical protein n=1 Tax=Rheinheimera sp. TaxID=1869214 RepID=UPI002734ACFD|nr:hypothetical protein [Rheinheimera sp.]MDP2716226.1 hypothetical protein [Rheinheimera sp.]
MQQAQTDPAAAVRLAARRLASEEYDAALRWLRQAALLGDNSALQHALQLQQRQQGRLATAQWLQQQLDSGTLTAQALTPNIRSELGLWQGNKATVAGFEHAQGCRLTLQPVASQQAGLDTWQQLLQQWQADKQLSQLPVCFLPLRTVNSTELACSEHSNSLVHCRYEVLADEVSGGDFSQLVVIAGRGKASYNNGILQLPDNAGLALLRHEFMHILGFIDEYQLSVEAATQVCQPGKHYPNLLLTADSRAYLAYWQLQAQDIALTPVRTCAALQQPAYRVIAQNNLMRSYELALPQLYFQLAQRILAQPEQLMPVQYYFAYLARQQQNWPQWQHFMQQASEWGYADAQQALDGTKG